MKKKLSVIVTLISATFLLTACGGPNKSASKTSSDVTTKTSKKASVKKSKKKAEKEKKDSQEKISNLIGTWQTSNNDSISFANDGSYTFSTAEGNRAGVFSIAGQYDQTLIVKMTNFDKKTPGLDTYLTFKLDSDNALSFGEYSGFKSLGKNTEIPSKLFMAKYLTSAPTTVSQKIIGTWTNQGTESHTYSTTSYNPDGTFESFSDASGFVSKGRYSVTGDDSKIEITSTRDDQVPHKIMYTMSKDFTVMTQNEPGIVFTYHKV